MMLLGVTQGRKDLQSGRGGVVGDYLCDKVAFADSTYRCKTVTSSCILVLSCPFHLLFSLFLLCATLPREM